MSFAYCIDANGYLVSTVSLDYVTTERTDLTTVEPPAFQFGYVRKFVNGAWVQVQDDRWKVWTLPDGKTWQQSHIGEPIPDDAVQVQGVHTGF